MTGDQLMLLPAEAVQAERYLDDDHNGDDWTFQKSDTRQLTHCYHDYPARMIPQIAGKLINTYGPKAKTIFDPYMGSGTTLVEGFVRGMDVHGVDLNPLARLISLAKVTVADPGDVDREIRSLSGYMQKSPSGDTRVPTEIAGITNLPFWFKPAVIQQLTGIRNFIGRIADDHVRLFFRVAFSETIRESSNSRVGEFKLYRYSEDVLKRWNPDVYGLMRKKLDRNRRGLSGLLNAIADRPRASTVSISDFNTVDGVPPTVAPGSVDIVVTSPPYGDSHTTVAYGQYSRLSAAWLGLDDPGTIDRRLMAGVIEREIPTFPCDPLNEAIAVIAQQDESRAEEVATFYSQLQRSIQNVAKTIRRRGVACYVVGNRRVKGVTLPTDQAIQCFFEDCKFDHLGTFNRTIPNKRMPSKNSPSNIAGQLDTTMAGEQIVVCRKR